ncbi:MAG: hypothetical protein AAGE52_11335 [Myxococcota bacterium]
MKYALVVLALACGGSEAPLARPTPEPQPAPRIEPAQVEPALASWGLRFVRPCSWGWKLFDGGDWLLACNSIFDTNGRYLQRKPNQSPLARVPQGTLWASGFWSADDDDVALLVRDASFAVTRRFALDKPVTRAAFFDSRIFGVGREGVISIDLEHETIAPVDGTCANNDTVFVSPSGQLHCYANQEGTTTLFRDGEVLLRDDGYLDNIRVDAQGRYVGQHENDLLWFDAEGEPLHREARPDRIRLLALLEDAALVHAEGRIERWRYANEELEVSPVQGATDAALLDRDGERFLLLLDGNVEVWTDRGGELDREPVTRASSDPNRRSEPAGRFVGPHVVVRVGDTLLWFSRGADAALPSGEVSFADRFEDCTRLTRNERGDFEGEAGTFVGDPSDVRAYTCDGTFLRVALSDASEFGGFEEDLAWGKAVMDRYGSYGAERWAYSWRDESGDRLLVGHYYIGGCERTHFLLTFAERGETIEHYVRAGEHSFLSIPEHAQRIAIDEGAYQGDPSIGFEAR